MDALRLLVQRKCLTGGGDKWALLATPDGASYVVLEGIKGHSACWPRVPGDELVPIGIGGMGVGDDNCAALDERADELVFIVDKIMNIKLHAKLRSSNGCAEGVVAQAATNLGLPLYRLIGGECKLIAPSDAHDAGEILDISKAESLILDSILESLSLFRPKLPAVLDAAALHVKMETGEPPLSIRKKLELRRLELAKKIYSYDKTGILGFPVAFCWRHGSISWAEFSSATPRPSVLAGHVIDLPGDIVDQMTDPGLEAGVIGLPQRIRGGIAHGIGQIGSIVITGAKWGYNRFRQFFGLKTAAEFSGLPVTTTAHQEGLSEHTNNRITDTMAQVYAASIPACFAAYPLLNDAPVHISSTIYGGLAFVTVTLYIGLLSRSEAGAKLAFRLVSVTAVSVLTVSFASQLSGPTYVKVLSGTLAGAVLNLIMLLLPFS